MVKPFSKKAEDELLNAVRDVTALVESDHLSPTDAIVKVAESRELSPTHVPLLVQAYNVGRCTFQREHGGKGVLNKTADFPIARVEDAMAQLFPDKPATPAEKAASTRVSDEYDRPPNWAIARQLPKPPMQKVAATREPFQVRNTYDSTGDPMIKMAKAYGQAERIKHAVEEARYQAGAAKDRLLHSITDLRLYFKQAASTRLTFSEVEFNAPRVIGAAAASLLDHVYQANGMREARCEGLPKFATAVDRKAAPYSLIAKCIECGRDAIEKQAAYAALAYDGQQKVASITRPFAVAPDATPVLRRSVLGGLRPVSSVKQSGMLEGMLGGVAGGMGKDLFAPKPTKDLVSDEVKELNDPLHVDELRQIQSRTMLSDLLANDEVISGFAPEEVTKAYNEISQLSPRASSQPAIMRPLLRKRLTAGSVEPFEAEQMANIEKTIRQTDTPNPIDKTAEVLRGYMFS